MVYHETRSINNKIQNYLIYNKRVNNKWIKKSKFIGTGKKSKTELKKLKEKFETELITEKCKHLTKEQATQIEELKNKYNKEIKKLNKTEFEKFEEAFFTEITYNSNAIEGNTLSLQETSLIINDNISPEGKTIREIYEAKNHQKALSYIKKYKGELTEELILKLHSIILKDISERFAGKYRQTNVRIAGSDFKLPSQEKVPQLIKNLLYWYKKNKNNYPPFELATLVSMKLVTIHPFVDGNGRVSRIIINFLLSKKNYPWINIYNKQRQKYLKATREANEENYESIFSFLTKTLEENIKDFF